MAIFTSAGYARTYALNAVGAERTVVSGCGQSEA
jgi:hypothetical protein